MLLYIIRHGDPIYETDTLTPRGILQAEALARRLSTSGINEIYSSPLGRAILTAKPAADILKLDINIEEWMNEGLAWNDLSTIDEKGERNWFFACPNSRLLMDGDALRSDWYNHPEAAKCSTAKTGCERIQTASDDFIQRLGYKREGNIYKILAPASGAPDKKRIAVFCHHGFGTAWMSHLLSIPPLVFWASFNITHTGISILDFEHQEDGFTSPRCLVHSDMSHIYEARLPMEYCNWIRV
jgi:probable phosphoglycerate mutase